MFIPVLDYLLARVAPAPRKICCATRRRRCIEQKRPASLKWKSSTKICAFTCRHVYNAKRICVEPLNMGILLCIISPSSHLPTEESPDSKPWHGGGTAMACFCRKTSFLSPNKPG